MNSRILVTVCLLVLQAAVFAQTGSIKGVIKTSDGKAAEFVNINLKGTQYFAIANEKGEYEIKKIKTGNYTLVASFTGLETQELPVEIKAGETTTINEITLRENLKQLKEVVVTTQRKQRDASQYVSKLPLKNVENSQVYSVIDKQLLTLQQVNNMEDAMKNATGVALVFPATGRATDGGSIYSLRGFSSAANLTDGIAGATLSNPDASNIERVEVLKGPSSTLFGSSLTGFGGAINTVTKKPYDSIGGSISLSSGSWGLVRMAADFNAPLNKEKTLLFRLNTAYHYQNSFQDFGFTKRFAVAPTVSYKASDKVSFLLQTNFSKITATLPSWYYADSATTHVTSADKLKIDNSKYYFGNDMATTTITAGAMAQMNIQLDNQWKSQSIFSISRNESTGPGPYLWFISDTSMTRNTQVWEGTTIQTNLQQNFTGDVKTWSVRHRLLFGADYYQNAQNSLFKMYNYSDIVYTNQKNANYLDYNMDNLEKSGYSYYFGTYAGKQTMKRVGAYAADVINITDELIVNLALRYDHYIASGLYDPTLDTVAGKYDQGGWSPKAGVIYQIVKNKVSLFGNYQNSFQNVNGQNINKETFKPQKANQFEGGVKFSLLQDRLSGTVSYYDIKVKNSVRVDPSNPLFSIQDGTQRSKGIEGELNIAAYKGLVISLGYAYNDNKFTKADSTVQGLRPVEAGPATTAHAFISYTVPNGELSGLGASFGGNYASKKYTTNDKVSGYFYLPSYTLLNASVFYDAPRFRLAVNVNNLTSERYWVGWNNITLQKPRELIASITWKF